MSGIIKGPGEDMVEAGCGLTGLFIVVPLLILLVIMFIALVQSMFS